MRNRQNDLYRKNTAALIAMANAKDEPKIELLRAERVKLSVNDRLILEAELAFQASALEQSEAEKRLVAQTQKANKMVKSIKTIAHVIGSAGKMAEILTRLIALL